MPSKLTEATQGVTIATRPLDEENIVDSDVTKSDHVRYIDKTRDYHRGEGYGEDYR